jgi:hypothetical protein
MMETSQCINSKVNIPLFSEGKSVRNRLASSPSWPQLIFMFISIFYRPHSDAYYHMGQELGFWEAKHHFGLNGVWDLLKRQRSFSLYDCWTDFFPMGRHCERQLAHSTMDIICRLDLVVWCSGNSLLYHHTFVHIILPYISIFIAISPYHAVEFWIASLSMTLPPRRRTSSLIKALHGRILSVCCKGICAP